MFAKRLLQKAIHHPQHDEQHGSVTATDLDLQISLHYGIPCTSSILAFDPIQRLLAIGTLDGRIKVIGGDSIEGLLISPKQLPYKNLEFLQNQGILVGISNDNDIQVWNMESRCIACSLQWGSNITAFSVIDDSHFMYIGDEYGMMSVLKYEAEDGKLLQLPYHISANSLFETAGFPSPNYEPIVGVLPQSCSSGNRVLIAYENGLIILWDVLDSRIVVVRGDRDLELNGVVDSPSEMDANLPRLEEKEISALCWASSDWSILAVGYIDGDILFWNTSTSASTKGQQAGKSSNNVVKLQLSSAERRLPVIVLHWSSSSRSCNNRDGKLFIYGGDEIGSEEVLTILSLEWSSGTEILKCVGRVDLTLAGSYADMILLPTSGAMAKRHNVALFLLTNPGQLHFYDDATLSALISQKERKPSVSAMEFPFIIPTANPCMTVAKLSLVGGNSSKSLSEMASTIKVGSIPTQAGGAKWPLTGGVPSHLSFAKDRIERVYIAGYQDGSVRIWDTTHHVISLICLFEGEVHGIKVAGSSASVTKLEFCFSSLRLAVGNDCGLVRVYYLNASSDDNSFHFVTESKHEVHIAPQEKGPQCIAAFCILNSAIATLKFSDHGAKLAVGFVCGRVAVLDMSSLSVMFLTDSVSGSNCPVISVIWKALMVDTHSSTESPKPRSKNPDNPAEELLFILTKDATFKIIDGDTGNMMGSRPIHLKREGVAISMYVIEGITSVSGKSTEEEPKLSSQGITAKNEPTQDSKMVGIHSDETEHHSSSETANSGKGLFGSLLLVCCEDALRLYLIKSVIQGSNKSIRKLKLAKPCYWTTTFKKDEKICGVVLLYQTGVIEIRSFPDFVLVQESSLMSILRWNFKANMDATISSSDNGQIALANGYEVAFISLLAGENDFGFPESLPCLHDKVLQAAADTAISFSAHQKKKKVTAPGILGGIAKGLKGGGVVHSVDHSANPKSNFTHLEGIFSSSPFLDPSTENHEVEELTLDDIIIDEPVSVASTSSHKIKNDKKGKGNEREKLFEGATADIKPRQRTPEEIIAKYRNAGDASSAAAQARNKLVQRQEKLERLSKNTAELQSGAEDFASLANELVKTMENRKWWNY